MAIFSKQITICFAFLINDRISIFGFRLTAEMQGRAGDHWIVPTHWFSIHFTLLFGITACPHHHKQWKQKAIAKGDFYSCSEIIKAGNYFMPPYLPPSVHPSKSIHDISIGTQNIFLQGHKNGVREEKFSALSSGQAQFFTGFYTIWLCAWSKHLDERKMWRKHHKWYMPWRHVNWRCNSIKSASCLLFFGLKHSYVKTNTCKLIVRSSCHSSKRESSILAKSVTDWKQDHLFFHHYFNNYPFLVSKISRKICILVVRNIWGRSAKYNLRFLDENYAHVLAIFCISVFINLEFCI